MFGYIWVVSLPHLFCSLCLFYAQIPNNDFSSYDHDQRKQNKFPVTNQSLVQLQPTTSQRKYVHF